MEQAPDTLKALLDRAWAAYKAGNSEASAEHLRSYFATTDTLSALRGLAYASDDPQQAIAAARLALTISPNDERAQQAFDKAMQRLGEHPAGIPERTHLRAAVAQVTRMTLRQARETIWRRKDQARTFGAWLDRNEINLSDLAFAVEKGWTAQVKDAATTLLLNRLLDIEPDQKPRALQVIQASRYSEKRERLGIILFGLLTGSSLTAALFSVVGFITLQVTDRIFSIPASCLFVVVIVSLLGLAAWGQDLLGNTIERLQQGRRGEELTETVLRDLLDGRWTLIRNWEWPNRRAGDIDAILIGPGGVWIFEVKAYSGLVRNRGARWDRKTKRWGWRPLRKSPGAQARRNAGSLKKFLESEGIAIKWVEAVVIWAKTEGELLLESPETPVWRVEEIPGQLETLWRGRHSLTDDEIQQVVSVLKNAASPTPLATPAGHSLAR
jgi:tetratricopeptide (TPR) repeat protein